MTRTAKFLAVDFVPYFRCESEGKLTVLHSVHLAIAIYDRIGIRGFTHLASRAGVGKGLECCSDILNNLIICLHA